MIGEDLSPFLATDEFASQILFDDGTTALGIFDDAYEVIKSGMGMASTAPAISLATADVPDAPVNQQVVIKGKTYVIAASEPDGTGMTVLILEAAF